MLEITPILQKSKKEPLYVQLYQYIKEEIISGAIPANSRLPSIRQLHQYLNVSRNTVEAGYHQLLIEGYVESKPRSGLFVVDLTSTIPLTQAPPFESRSQQVQETSTIDIDFRYGTVDSEHFPSSVWRKLTLQFLHSDQQQLFTYGDPQGEFDLRQQLATYLHFARGVHCSPDQIVIGAGIQHVIGVLAQLLRNDSTVAIEDPGYDGVRAVFSNHHLPLIPIPLDDGGMRVDDLMKSNATVAYITPSHQFPCGMVMPLKRRLQLLEWAQEKDGIIIEDDYDGEFRYVGKPIPALQGLDQHNKIVYLGSLSKSFLPSLRMGYMILPFPLLARYKQMFRLFDQPVPLLSQLTLTEFMKQGHWDSHIRKMRTIYQKKQAVLIAEIEKSFQNQVELLGNEAGLHLLLAIENGMTEEELIEKAVRKRVAVYPVSRHMIEPSTHQKPMIQLGFGGLSKDQIIDGVNRLKQAWF